MSLTRQLREEKGENRRFPLGKLGEEIVRINRLPPTAHFTPASEVGTAGWGGGESNHLEICDGG